VPFRPGKFDREELPRPLRRVCPDEAVHGVIEVDLEALYARGKRLVLLDVDNTILPWKADEVPKPCRDWIEGGRRIGLRFCLISNTRRPERLARIAESLGIPRMRGKFKPSRRMYLQALEEFGCTEAETIMIGDQLFTDVLGAYRAGIESIWVRPLAKREFAGTKLARIGEKLVRPWLYRALEEAPGDLPIVTPTGIFASRVVRQFVKFCIVGGSSTVIDLGLHFLLMFVVASGGVLLSVALGEYLLATFPTLFAFAGEPKEAAFPVLKVLTASLAVLNSFYWNRRWTFGIRGGHRAAVQLTKFTTVAVIGMLLNTTITTTLNTILPGPPKHTWAIAAAVATVIVVFWNFSGQRLWTFRKTLHT
jgi:HAD superfamily phosphatase (TIGR01668 family)